MNYAALGQQAIALQHLQRRLLGPKPPLWRRFKCAVNWHDDPDALEPTTPAHFFTYTCRYCGRIFKR